jgi:hypothetical protein
MSTEQLSELAMEMSNLSEAERDSAIMLLQFEVRFWRHKAWRAEQQRDREIQKNKELEEIAGKYKDLPEEILQSLLLIMKKEELLNIQKKAEVHFKDIGLVNYLKLQRDAAAIEGLDGQIKFWKGVMVSYIQPEE